MRARARRLPTPRARTAVTRRQTARAMARPPPKARPLVRRFRLRRARPQRVQAAPGAPAPPLPGGRWEAAAGASLSRARRELVLVPRARGSSRAPTFPGRPVARPKTAIPARPARPSHSRDVASARKRRVPVKTTTSAAKANTASSSRAPRRACASTNWRASVGPRARTLAAAPATSASTRPASLNPATTASSAPKAACARPSAPQPMPTVALRPTATRATSAKPGPRATLTPANAVSCTAARTALWRAP